MRRYAWIPVAVVAADQAMKAFARRLSGTVTLIPGLLGLTYRQNTGMAFSLLSGHPWLLAALSAALILGCFAWLRRYRLGWLPAVGAMLALGGAVGNLIDRVLIGYVTDMFEVLLFRFAIFNVADVAITIGCFMLAASMLFCPKDWSVRDAKD